MSARKKWKAERGKLHKQEPYIEDVRIIGIYSSKELAQEAIEQAKILSGFCDYPAGFQITKYTLDKDQWHIGFKFVQ